MKKRKGQKEQTESDEDINGEWHLVYLHGRRFGGPGDTDLGEYECRVSLGVTNLIDVKKAIKEGRKKWEEILKDRTAKWKKQIRGSTYHSTTAFGGVWPKATIIYRLNNPGGFRDDI